MPQEWRHRFAAFARATPLLEMPRPLMHEDALAAPLWYITQLGTRADVLANGHAPQQKVAWRRWAAAGIVQVGDMYDTNARRFASLRLHPPK